MTMSLGLSGERLTQRRNFDVVNVAQFRVCVFVQGGQRRYCDCESGLKGRWGVRVVG